MARKQKNPIDTQIERAYYRLAQGKQINIMRIPALFADCRTAVKNGEEVEAAVQAAVDRYCTAA